FRFDEFISLATVTHSYLKNTFSWNDWTSVTSSSQFFIKLAPNVPVSQAEKQLASFNPKYVKDQDFLLQPLRDIHFNADYDAFDQPQGNKSVLYGLIAVAIFLLILGCINFINLNTAQASQRAKEIGVRKTLGGSRKQLVIQFLSETCVLTV